MPRLKPHGLLLPRKKCPAAKRFARAVVDLGGEADKLFVPAIPGETGRRQSSSGSVRAPNLIIANCSLEVAPWLIPGCPPMISPHISVSRKTRSMHGSPRRGCQPTGWAVYGSFRRGKLTSGSVEMARGRRIVLGNHGDLGFCM